MYHMCFGLTLGAKHGETFLSCINNLGNDQEVTSSVGLVI